jgi:hypothetical protein
MLPSPPRQVAGDARMLLIDHINDRYGRCAIGFGLLPPEVRAFKGHAAFHRVPERWEFKNPEHHYILPII